MKGIVAIAITALIASVIIFNIDAPATPSIAVEPIDYMNINAECNKELELECAVDVERTIIACAKAFETGGASVIADIKCAKDLLADKKHCWPCICAEAKKKGWHVVGC